MKRLFNILLLFIPLLASANETEMSGLHCGEVVTITATPEAGYHFVSWSDGNTDNPRDIVVSQALDLTAYYAPDCDSDWVPVVMLYGQLMMVDVNSMLGKGYVFSEQNVSWYRIVGDIDILAHEYNDLLLGTGYYYNLSEDQTGLFYATVDVGSTPQSTPPRCSDILYSPPVSRDTDDTSGLDKEKVKKLLIDNQLYFIVGPLIYRADGTITSL